MKTKKAIFMSVIIYIILFLCGCTNDSSNKSSSSVDENMLVSSLSQALNNASNIVEDEKIPEYIAYLEEKSTFEVISADNSNDTTINSKIKITAPDLYSTINKIKSEMDTIDENQFDKTILDELKKASVIVSEEDLQFKFVDGKYQPILTDSFLDAYYGGIFRLREEWIASMVEEE